MEEVGKEDGPRQSTMNQSSQVRLSYRGGYHPSLGQASVFDTTSGTASFAVGEAGALTATSLALVGLGPIGGIVAIGTQIVAMIIKQFSGCGQTCVLTSEAADQVEGAIKQMFAAYMTSGHTKSEQAAYLQQFDALWAKLEQYCGSGSFGKAGVNCIADRQAGACKWKTSAWGWQQANGVWSFVPSGAAGAGDACWNWVDYYRGSVANDPTVVPDTPSVSQAVQQITGLTGSSPTGMSIDLTPILIIGGLLVLGSLI